MGKKKNTNNKRVISIKDYMKAVKRADREIELEQQPGWKRSTAIHKSKKAYDRRNNKKNFLDE